MVVLQILVVLFAALALLRLFRVDGGRHTCALLALTPYTTAGGLLIGALALALRQWWAGGALLVLAGLAAATVLPRTLRTRRPRSTGRRLRLLSSNLLFGRGDVKTVVELVREHQVDVLHLLELTPEAAEEFDRAGLFELLPHRVFQPAANGSGSGLAARHPLVELSLAGPAHCAQPSARIDLHGTPVDLVAVHPIPPTTSARAWKRELAGLPLPDQSGPVRVLAGDFNATLDHANFRRLLRAGYADAADRRGTGLMPTWPAKVLPPPVTLDHVLVDRRASVADYRVLPVPNSDHHAVYAELLLPT